MAKHFDQHVRTKLPWYDLATNAVTDFGRHYISACADLPAGASAQAGASAGRPRKGVVYDIGASPDNIGLALSETLDQRQARFFAIE